MKTNTDHYGIILGCACLVHCIALPFILVGMSFSSELVHTFFLLAAIVITSHAVYHSYRKHCKHIVIWFASAGILMLGADFLVEHHDDGIEWFPIIGSMFLITTHMLNLFYSRKLVTSCGGCK